MVRIKTHPNIWPDFVKNKNPQEKLAIFSLRGGGFNINTPVVYENFPVLKKILKISKLTESESTGISSHTGCFETENCYTTRCY